MIQEWFETDAENRQQNKTFYIDITDKEENALSLHMNPNPNPKKQTYQIYHGRYLEYIANPEQNSQMAGFTKIKEEYRGEIIAFDGRAIDEIAYMDSVFEFEFYWHPRLNWGIMSTKRGHFNNFIYDRFDYEDILEYDSGISGFFHEDSVPNYTLELASSSIS